MKYSCIFPSSIKSFPPDVESYKFSTASAFYDPKLKRRWEEGRTTTQERDKRGGEAAQYYTTWASRSGTEDKGRGQRRESPPNFSSRGARPLFTSTNRVHVKQDPSRVSWIQYSHTAAAAVAASLCDTWQGAAPVPPPHAAAAPLPLMVSSRRFVTGTWGGGSQ